jgi:hypothetical protein
MFPYTDADRVQRPPRIRNCLPAPRIEVKQVEN